MNHENEATFYIDFTFIRRLYPMEISKRVKNFGVLEQYRDKKYTLREINEIIAELIVKVPYISHAMRISMNVKSNRGYHHMLEFQNYEYASQPRTESEEIAFLYE